MGKIDFSKFIRRCYSGKNSKYTKYQQQSVRVAILGADTITGELTAFLLKQNPIVSGIFLQGSNKILGLKEDLKDFDTRSRVAAYHGKGSYGNAARSADIVLVLNSPAIEGTTSARKAFKAEAKRITEIAEECSTYAPKSIIVCSACPVSFTLPLIRNIYKKGHWYHPGRILGSISGLQVKAISMVANQQDLDPKSVNVPIIGGPDVDCMVPLFSRATPVSLTSYEAAILTKKFRRLPEDFNLFKSPVPFKPEIAPIGESYALNGMVTAIGLGLCGDADAVGSAFVRTNVIYGCTHCVCTVKYGTTGIHHNFGVPKLTNLEVQLLEKALILLHEREQYVRDYMQFQDEEKAIAEEEAKKKIKPPEQEQKQQKTEIELPFQVQEGDFPCKVET